MAQSRVHRTHRIGEICVRQAGSRVRVAGFVHRKRSLGSVVFVELRDASGVIQCVVEANCPVFQSISALKLESVVSFDGDVALRESEHVNPELPTGAVELRVTAVDVHSVPESLPFPVASTSELPEELRLTYRHLDLRRARVHDNVLLRSRIIARLRQLCWERGFVELQTPILTSSSPEGARDFLVPSRLHRGRFYALPQAPQ